MFKNALANLQRVADSKFQETDASKAAREFVARAEIQECPSVHIIDEHSMWKKFMYLDIQSRLPFRTIHIRDAAGENHVVSQIDLHMKETTLQHTIEQGGAHVDRERSSGADMYKDPFAFVFVLRCEEYETYKSQMRPRISQFISAMQKHGFEWLLVYVPLGSRAPKDLNKQRKVYKKVTDKLRSDFDLGKSDRDRMFKLELFDSDVVDASQELASFMERLVGAVAEGFHRCCVRYVEAIKSLYALQSTRQWDYHRYFLTVEGLGLVYTQMRLQKKARNLYDDLELLQETEYGLDSDAPTPETPSKKGRYSSLTPQKTPKRRKYSFSLSSFSRSSNEQSTSVGVEVSDAAPSMSRERSLTQPKEAESRPSGLPPRPTRRQKSANSPHMFAAAISSFSASKAQFRHRRSASQGVRSPPARSPSVSRSTSRTRSGSVTDATLEITDVDFSSEEPGTGKSRPLRSASESFAAASDLQGFTIKGASPAGDGLLGVKTTTRVSSASSASRSAGDIRPLALPGSGDADSLPLLTLSMVALPNGIDMETASFLDLSTVDFRELIRKRSISRLCFRLYVYTRQAQLIVREGGVRPFAARGKDFLKRMSAWFSEHRVDDDVSPKHERHLMSLCKAIVDVVCLLCGRQKSSSMSVVPQAVTTLRSRDRRRVFCTLGELMSTILARITRVAQQQGLSGFSNRVEADLRGIHADWLASAQAADDVVSSRTDTRSGSEITALSYGLGTESDIEAVFVDCARCAMCGFKHGGRERTVSQISSRVAMVYFRQKRFLEAFAIFFDVWHQLGNEDWSMLAIAPQVWVAKSALRCGRYEDYLSTCVALLSSSDARQVFPPASLEQLQEEMLKTAQSLKHEAPLALPILDHVFEITSVRCLWGDAETEYHHACGCDVFVDEFVRVELCVTSRLPSELKVQSIRLSLLCESGDESNSEASTIVGEPGIEVLLTANHRTLKSGETVVVVSSEGKLRASGIYRISRLQVQLPDFALVCDLSAEVFPAHEVMAAFELVAKPRAPRVTASILLTSSAIDSATTHPRHDDAICVGVPQTLLVTVDSNEDVIDAGSKLTFSHEVDSESESRPTAWSIGLDIGCGVIYNTNGEELKGHQSPEKGSLTLPEVPPHTSLKIAFPLKSSAKMGADAHDAEVVDMGAHPDVNFNLSLNYFHLGDVALHLQESATIPVVLPLRIDYSLLDCGHNVKILQVMAACTTYRAVEICDAVLRLPEKSMLRLCDRELSPKAPVSVSPGQSYSFVFELTCSVDSGPCRMLEHEDDAYFEVLCSPVVISKECNESAPIKPRWPIRIAPGVFPVIFSTELHAPPIASIGQFVTLKVRVSCHIDDSVSSQELNRLEDTILQSSSPGPHGDLVPSWPHKRAICEVVCPSDTWVISGTCRVTIDFGHRSDASFSCRILPLKQGVLPLPSLKVFRLVSFATALNGNEKSNSDNDRDGDVSTSLPRSAFGESTTGPLFEQEVPVNFVEVVPSIASVTVQPMSSIETHCEELLVGA